MPDSKCPILLACDENYAMPLATTLRSLVETNERHWPLDVTVLTDGFAERTRTRVTASLPSGSAALRWSSIDLSPFAPILLALQSARRRAHSAEMSYLDPRNAATIYGRLTLEQAFASDVQRILYLDADILVLEDLGPLFDVDLGDDILAAVPDDYVDAAIQARNAGPLEGVPNVARYFNAGLMVINLDRWRSHDMAKSAIEYMVKFPNSRYSDQDGLNAACNGRWIELNGRWNYQSHRTVRISALPPAERPAVVHFITGQKPWLPSSTSLNAGLYDSYRDRTKFRRGLHSRVRDSMTRFAHRGLRKVRTALQRIAGD
jgi:lipopolysaccharide biosynthesis glycosyltransferase